MYADEIDRLKASLGLSARAVNALRYVGVDVEDEFAVRDWVYENSLHLKRVPGVGHGTAKELLERFDFDVPTQNVERVERSKKIVSQWLKDEISADSAMRQVAFLMDFRIK